MIMNQGMVLHACTYRRPDDYVDKKVVIVGGANTAGDLAVEIGNVAKQVRLTLVSVDGDKRWTVKSLRMRPC